MLVTPAFQPGTGTRPLLQYEMRTCVVNLHIFHKMGESLFASVFNESNAIEKLAPFVFQLKAFHFKWSWKLFLCYVVCEVCVLQNEQFSFQGGFPLVKLSACMVLYITAIGLVD